eukprot:322696-Chlamydomonas_euryale.AAC.2
MCGGGGPPYSSGPNSPYAGGGGPSPPRARLSVRVSSPAPMRCFGLGEGGKRAWRWCEDAHGGGRRRCCGRGNVTDVGGVNV